MMRLIGFISLCLLLVSTTGCNVIAAQFQSPSERFRVEGDRLLGEERTAEAILAYRAAVDHDPANLEAVTRLAPLYARQGRTRLALRLLQSAAKLAPQDQRVQNALAGLPASPNPAPFNPDWSTFLGDSEPVGFSLEAGRVYASLNDGSILAVDAASGAILWKNRLPAQATSAPAAEGGRVWVGAQDGALYALSPQDGAPVWKFTTRAPVYAPPAFQEQTVYLPSGDGTLYALDLASGTLKWSFATRGALHARPSLANGNVYFGSNDGYLYALAAASGTPVWANGIRTQGAVESPAVISAGRVFFGSGDTRLYALDAASGGEYWRYSTPDAVYAAPLIAGEWLYAASAGNTLTALDPLSGKKIWEFKAASALPYPPLLSKNRLFFVVSGSANLFALDAQSGALLFSADSGDWLSAAPLLYGDQILLLGKDSTLQSYHE